MPKLLTESERESKIIELCDKDFLDKLTEVAKLYGWAGDYVEIDSFIRYLCLYTDTPIPDLEPYEYRE